MMKTKEESNIGVCCVFLLLFLLILMAINNVYSLILEEKNNK